MSAVSNSVTPRSIALWITLREASRSMRWPKLLQPRPTAETRRPEAPRLRISMGHPVRGLMDKLTILTLWRGHARWAHRRMRNVRTKRSGPGQTRRLTGTAGGADDRRRGPDQTHVKASPAL